MHILWWIIVGPIAGWATGTNARARIFRAERPDLIVGVPGAVVLTTIVRLLTKL